MKTIIDKILYLNPEAKFSIWDCHENEYQGDQPPIKLGKYLVCWNPTNPKSCPTMEELDAVTLPA